MCLWFQFTFDSSFLKRTCKTLIKWLNYWNADAGNTASVTCVWVCDQCCQVRTFPTELAYFCRGLLFSLRVKAIPLWPPSGALRFFANLVDFDFKQLLETAQNATGLDLPIGLIFFHWPGNHVFLDETAPFIHTETCRHMQHALTGYFRIYFWWMIGCWNKSYQIKMSKSLSLSI